MYEIKKQEQTELLPDYLFFSSRRRHTRCSRDWSSDVCSSDLVTEAGDTRFFAGWRSDPFFCDVEGAKNNFQFTSDDFFAEKDVCSIVLEVPNSALGAKEVRLWARTLTPDDGGGWLQVERGARPAQAVILVEEREAYLGGEPATDGRFLASFAHALEHTGGYTSAEAKRVAATLLPDILPYDSSRPASFPDNGRALTDDAFDCFMRVLTNGKVNGDNVGRSEEHTSELQSRLHLVCRLLLEKKKKKNKYT